MFNILCLQSWVTYGETHEYGAGSLHSSLSCAQMLIVNSAHIHMCAHTHTVHTETELRDMYTHARARSFSSNQNYQSRLGTCIHFHE